MSSTKLTNTLLAAIALLLLILVIQNGTRPSHPPAGLPADLAQEMPDDHQNFDPVLMVSAALSCPGNGAMTLADPGCSGGDADRRRHAIEEAFAQNLPIPQVFDSLVEKFGENALTPQAREIRKARRAGR